MKRKLLLLTLLSCFGLNSVYGQQQPNAVSEILSAGNIKAPIYSDGPLFWHKKLGSPINSNVQWESPKHSGKGTIIASNFWIGGLDQQNNLYICAETYRQSTVAGYTQNYYFGPVANTYNAAFDAKYNKVWKVTAAEINYHKLNFRRRFYTMPDGIANWPAHGDASNGEATNLAPFVDVNQNNIYDPLNGDYPVIRGSETLYFILNDKRSRKTPLTPAMNIEIHGMAYAFDNPADSALYCTVFLNYRIINRSVINYTQMYAGIWTDFDIGYYDDDHIASDVQRNAFYAYNALPLDTFNAYPHLAYGNKPPAQGVAFLGNTKLNSFVYHTNDHNPISGIPRVATAFYNYLRGIWMNNQPLTFGDDGKNPANEHYRYMFPGSSDPIGKGFTPNHTPPFDWNMQNINAIGQILNPTDVRGVGAFGPFNLNAGEEICFDVAFPFAQGNDHLHSVSLLKRYIDQINQFHTATYGNTCIQNQTATNPPNSQRHAFESLFPNPATKEVTLYFDQRLTEDVTISVYDVNGKKQSTKLLRKDDSAVQTVNLQDLKPGVYILNMVDGGSSKKLKVVVTK